MKYMIKTWFVVGTVLILSACSSHPARPDCQSHLRPINTPAPVSSSGAAKP